MNTIVRSKKASLLRFLKFGIVGGSGVVVNVGLLHAFTSIGKIDYKLASICAIECAVINNFLWNYFWTWKDRQVDSKRSFAYMFFKFHLSSGLTALIVNWGLLVLLTDVMQIKYHIPFVSVSDMHVSNLIGIACGAVVNFFWGISGCLKKNRKLKKLISSILERPTRPLYPVRKMQIVIRASRSQSRPEMHEQKPRTNHLP